MELRVQLEKWAAQAESADMESAADMDVAVRLLNHGIEALDQLEASKQRELELLAVIENLKDVLSDLRDVQNGSPLPKYDADWEDAMRRTDEALAGIEPSQALREHEAKALEEAADYLDNHCCATGHITSDSTLNELRRMAEERRKKCTACDGAGDVHRADGEYLGQCPNCAKPFPAPKQEEK